MDYKGTCRDPLQKISKVCAEKQTRLISQHVTTTPEEAGLVHREELMAAPERPAMKFRGARGTHAVSLKPHTWDNTLKISKATTARRRLTRV